MHRLTVWKVDGRNVLEVSESYGTCALPLRQEDLPAVFSGGARYSLACPIAPEAHNAVNYNQWDGVTVSVVCGQLTVSGSDYWRVLVRYLTERGRVDRALRVLAAKAIANERFFHG